MTERPRNASMGDPRRELGGPDKPPDVFLRRDVRRTVFWGFFVPLVALTLIVGAGLLYYWAMYEPKWEDQGAPAVGTTGERTPGDLMPGQRPEDTDEELERRGAGTFRDEPRLQPEDAAPLDRIGPLRTAAAQDLIGRRIDIRDAQVVEAGDTEFWIQQGYATAAVAPPPQAGGVEVGMMVDVSGMVEPDGRGGLRIRATRVTVQ